MRITPSVNLQNNMKLEQIKWPVYVLHSDEIEERDGLLFCDTEIVDDKNMKGETLGLRRLQSDDRRISRFCSSQR